MTPEQWLTAGDTSISSKTLHSVMTGTPYGGARFCDVVPLHNDDFGRCHRLLKHFPEWRERLPELVAHYPEWAPQITVWDELTALYEAVCDAQGRYTAESYSANPEGVRILFDRLSELRAESRFIARTVAQTRGDA